MKSGKRGRGTCFGKGKVIPKRPVEEVLAAMEVKPDFAAITRGA